jgi:hypothetical protein
MNAPLASTNARPTGLTSETLALACRVAELYFDDRVTYVDRYTAGGRFVLFVKCGVWPALEFATPPNAPDLEAAMRAEVATLARLIGLQRLGEPIATEGRRGAASALLRISDGEIRP